MQTVVKSAFISFVFVLYLTTLLSRHSISVSILFIGLLKQDSRQESQFVLLERLENHRYCMILQ